MIFRITYLVILQKSSCKKYWKELPEANLSRNFGFLLILKKPLTPLSTQSLVTPEIIYQPVISDQRKESLISSFGMLLGEIINFLLKRNIRTPFTQLSKRNRKVLKGKKAPL